MHIALWQEHTQQDNDDTDTMGRIHYKPCCVSSKNPSVQLNITPKKERFISEVRGPIN